MGKNLWSKLKQKKGYTLTEMMIVVGIIVVLLGISIVGVAGMKENLKMAELDDYAKIIYLEAQDQLSIIEVEGALNSYKDAIRTQYPTQDWLANPEVINDLRFLKEIYPSDPSLELTKQYPHDYPLTNPSLEPAEKELATKLWEDMCYLGKQDSLLKKLIYETSDIYNNGGSYLIEFNPRTGDIYGVFYWEKNEDISYKDVVMNLDSRERSDRKDDKIGYYGGTLAGDLEEEKSFLQKVTLVNSEELYLKISVPNTEEFLAHTSSLEISVEITGENNKTKTFDSIDLSKNFEVNTSTNTIDYHLLLDSMYEGYRFNDIVNAGKTTEAEQIIIPGENLTIKVTGKYIDNGVVKTNVKSTQGNSLFASDTNENYVSISALRHMLNLNKEYYNAENFDSRTKIQYISNVDFKEEAYSWDLEGSEIKYRGNCVANRPAHLDHITPIENDTLFSDSDSLEVTGKNDGMKYVLSNFVVKPEADALGNPIDNVAIFGTVQDTAFSNIYVENITVDAENCSNVGALIGYMKNGSITDCGVYLANRGSYENVKPDGSVEITEEDYCKVPDLAGGCHENEMDHRYDTYRIKGNNNVGGLVGKVESDAAGVVIDKAFAAIKVSGADSATMEPKIDGAVSCAGGLIGYASITGGDAELTIKRSYASGDVFGKEYAGGFAGAIVSNGNKKVAVTDNYATGNVYGNRNFGGFLGQTQKAEYDKCISYGEVIKLGEDEKYVLKAEDQVGGFVYDAASIEASYTDCVYMSQMEYNKSDGIKNPGDISTKEYTELLSAELTTTVDVAYPYSKNLYMENFPFKKLDEQKVHYGNWPKKAVIDTSLVYYEKYADGSYGYYCVTTGAGNTGNWLLNTLKPETCIEDGYGLLTKYNLEKISYDLYIGNQKIEKNGTGYKYETKDQNGNTVKKDAILVAESENVTAIGNIIDKEDGRIIGRKRTDVPVVLREDVEGDVYNDEKFLYLNKQGRLTFKELESYDAVNGIEGTETGDTFEIAGLYLYQLPYDLQCTDRKGVPYFYDRIVFNAIEKGGDNEQVIQDLSFLYCPHFAKTAYNPNIGSGDIDLAAAEPVERPKNVFLRTARHLNALGRFSYYWNTRHGLEEQVNYIQETDINFSTYTKVYGGRKFDLQDLNEPYRNRPIGNSDYGFLGETGYAGQFKNSYDGRGHKIIDYCVYVSDVQFVGLFGEIKDATLKNIVMVMSNAPKGDAGLIKSDYKTWMTVGDDSRRREMRASVGALLGMAYDNTYCDDVSNTIDNCVAAGYRVQFVLKEGANPHKPSGSTDLDPLGIVVGGLIGYGESDITNCAAVNDVSVVLEKDYTNTYAYWDYHTTNKIYQPLNDANKGGIINIGGFTGSYFYSKVANCYSGGTIKVIDNGYDIPHLRVGNFCPGWLDTRAYGISYKDYEKAEKGEHRCSPECACTKIETCNHGNNCNCSADANTFRSFEYENCYTYTTVYDSVWDANVTKTMNYVPFASSKVDFFDRNNQFGKWKIREEIPDKYTTFTNVYYLDEVADKGMSTDGNKTKGEGVTSDELIAKATKKVADDKTYIYANVPNTAADYPYHAVIQEVDANTGAKTGTYVHYGPWYTDILPDTILAYYEGYDNTGDGIVDEYGYYSVTNDKDGNDAWVLNSLQDKACIEDGYGLITKYELDSLGYKKTNETEYTPIELNSEKGTAKIEIHYTWLRFKGYKSYDEKYGNGVDPLGLSVSGSEKYVNLYKLPYELQNDSGTTNFYTHYNFTGESGSVNVIEDIKSSYNPHFAKTALNLPNITLKRPTNVSVRSARQLNALGRNAHYWAMKNDESGKNNGRLAFIQETDINFSTYTKTYMGQEFNLQTFDPNAEYRNRPIGRFDSIENSANPNAFKCTYDGRSNLIIDYCVSVDDTPYAGLFGVIRTGTLKNIVMVVSSNPESENAGKIISSYRVGNNKAGIPVDTYDKWNDRIGVGSLIGWAYGKVGNNTIENCAVSGYTVQYEHGAATTGTDPQAIAIGGFIGLSQSTISDCTAANEVKIKLNKSYSENGRVYLGGFAGSQMYHPVANCYSGGTIEVENKGENGTTYKIPYLRVGGFCPGWLDTHNNEGYYPELWFADRFSGMNLSYENIYSYTKVSDSIWGDESTQTIYVPLVSSMVEWNNGELGTELPNRVLGDAYEQIKDSNWHIGNIKNDITKKAISSKEKVISFEKNKYVESLSIGHLKRMENVKVNLEWVDLTDKEKPPVEINNTTNYPATAFFMDTNGVNFTAAGVSFASLKAGENDNTVTNKNTYITVDKNGKWTQEINAYPYPAVIRKADKLDASGKANGDYVHYGPWIDGAIESTLAYYEKYEGGAYGYYSVVTDPTTDKTLVLDTLQDKTVVEDGYGLLTQHELESLRYDLFASNKGNSNPPEGEIPLGDKQNTGNSLVFKQYATFDRATGKTEGSVVFTDSASNIKYFYKLPFELQFNEYKDAENKDIRSGFYDLIVLNATVGGEEVIHQLPALYNPHFAKNAINLQANASDATPTNVFVRSARQLNALGRNHYYWQLKSGSAKINFVQETDISFSKYVKNYLGREGFDLQAFNTDYSNRPIGSENKMFQNNYNGQSNLIIDYCVDGGTDIQYVGLFGKITNTTLENIVMVVSSNPGENGGKITGSFQTTSDKKDARAGVGALLGFAYTRYAQSAPSNVVDNCAASGYTVQYELKKDLTSNKDYAPVGVGVGGLIGFSHTDISNSSATNDVRMILHRNYDNTYAKEGNDTKGIVHLGGFIGSLMYAQVSNCYSGGNIDVDNDGTYGIPYLNIGGFCPGWLDIILSKNGLDDVTYDNFVKNFKGEYAKDKHRIAYQNIYSYTKVSDTVWDIPAEWDSNGTVTEKFTNYVPLVSDRVYRISYNKWVVNSIIQDGLDTNKQLIVFQDNLYLNELTSAHLKRTPDDVKKYYMNAEGNFTANETNFYGLENNETQSRNTVTVTEKSTNTFTNGDLDANGNLESSSIPYPYPAVVKDQEGNFVHYGEWLDGTIESALAYYEKYENGDYGYYSVVTDSIANKNYVLDTLEDKVAVEDGYGLLTQYDLASLRYDLFTSNQNNVAPLEDEIAVGSPVNTDNKVVFKEYANYNQALGEVSGEGVATDVVSNFKNFYKLSFELQFNESQTRTAFYDMIVLNADTAGGADVIHQLSALYNPHFAKNAINLQANASDATPTNVFVRSARQLNALGRNNYYWQLKDGNGGKVNYIQETDINFSTYGDNVQETGTDNIVKKYLDQDFGIQEFNATYSNKPIGQAGKSFINNYDGCSNAIIDYCVDGGIDEMYVGLFGEIKEAALKNIVMVVSSNPGGEGGKITSSFQVPSTGKIALRAGVGALVGFAYEYNPISKSSNTIKNCAASGYTVWYELKEMLKTYDPVGVAVGGLVGHSQSDISDSSATNDVRIVLHRDYNKTYFSNHRSIVNLGGFVGSFMYAQVSNCYSGGKIDVDNAGNYSIWCMNVGGFCPGWLDILCGKSTNGSSGFTGFNRKDTSNNDEQKIAYKNIYSYTEVSDNIWNRSNSITNYFPLVSRAAYFIYADKWRVAQPISDSQIIFDKENNMYVESLSTGHLKKMTGDRATNKVTGNSVGSGPTVSVDSFYMKDGENCTATGVSFAELAQKAGDIKATGNNTYINGDRGEDGKLKPYGIEYPYQPVIREATGKNESGETTYGDYVHYGPWSDGVIESVLAYYEKYAENDYGYYSVVTDSTSTTDKKWVLNTLQDKTVIEDGYGLLTKHNLDSLKYELFASNVDNLNPSKAQIPVEGGQDIRLDGTFTFKPEGSTTGNINVANLTKFYKLPFDLQFNENQTRTGFYDMIVFNGTAGGKEVIHQFPALYNPHFAKNAINPQAGVNDTTPTEVYVRSARQLNALGRNNYYWQLKDGNDGKVNYIQETDINFSTYAYNKETGNKNYLGAEFNLQSFDANAEYRNRPIGNTENKRFKNNYNGCSNLIIDYCLDSGTTARDTGLFGAIEATTLENIVMVVSSNPTSENAGIITSSWDQYGTGTAYKAAVGALFGSTFERVGWKTTTSKITNCAVSGYTVRYLVKEGITYFPVGIAVGGLGGLSKSEITDCTATNNVILELDGNYKTPYPDAKNYGMAYLGGFVGSQMYAPIENCYSGGYIDVIDNLENGEYTAPEIKVGGFCPGWLCTNYVHENSEYGIDFANKDATDTPIKVKYKNIYSYTGVSDNIWAESYHTMYVPLVSNMVDWYYIVEYDNGNYDRQWKTTPHANISFEGNMYVESLSAAHLKKVTKDVTIYVQEDGTEVEKTVPAKSFYMNVETGENFTAKEVSLSGLTVEGAAIADKDHTFITYDLETGQLISADEAYPYPAKVTEENKDAAGNVSDVYVHYGPWPDKAVKNVLTYYEVYANEDGTKDYGFYYLKNDRTLVSSITTDHARPIESAGYGYLTTYTEDVEYVDRAIAYDIIDGECYYLRTLTDEEWNTLLPENGAPYKPYEYTYKTNGTIQTATIYVNGYFGAAISATDDLGRVDLENGINNPLQVRTKEQFEKVGILTEEYANSSYIKQTHDVDLKFDKKAENVLGHTNVLFSITYDGCAGELGCVIKNAAIAPFNLNNGTIINTRVVGFDSSMGDIRDNAAGFVVTNAKIIENCSVVAENLKAKCAYGFVIYNERNITNCSVEGTITGEEEAIGFVGDNAVVDSHIGNITNCTVTATMQARDAYGFAEMNRSGAAIQDCTATVKVIATGGPENPEKVDGEQILDHSGLAMGFMEQNAGLVSDCTVYLADSSDSSPAICSEKYIASGFAYINYGVDRELIGQAPVDDDNDGVTDKDENGNDKYKDVYKVTINESGTIQNCKVEVIAGSTGTVKSENGFAYGFIYKNPEDAVIENCSVEGITINGKKEAVGFADINKGTITNSEEANNSSVVATIISNKEAVGFVRDNYATVTLCTVGNKDSNVITSMKGEEVYGFVKKNHSKGNIVSSTVAAKLEATDRAAGFIEVNMGAVDQATVYIIDTIKSDNTANGFAHTNGAPEKNEKGEEVGVIPGTITNSKVIAVGDAIIEGNCAYGFANYNHKGNKDGTEKSRIEYCSVEAILKGNEEAVGFVDENEGDMIECNVVDTIIEAIDAYGFAEKNKNGGYIESCNTVEVKLNATAKRAAGFIEENMGEIRYSTVYLVDSDDYIAIKGKTAADGFAYQNSGTIQGCDVFSVATGTQTATIKAENEKYASGFVHQNGYQDDEDNVLIGVIKGCGIGIEKDSDSNTYDEYNLPIITGYHAYGFADENNTGSELSDCTVMAQLIAEDKDENGNYIWTYNNSGAAYGMVGTNKGTVTNCYVGNPNNTQGEVNVLIQGTRAYGFVRENWSSITGCSVASSGQTKVSVISTAKPEGNNPADDQDRGMAIGFVSDNYGTISNSYVRAENGYDGIVIQGKQAFGFVHKNRDEASPSITGCYVVATVTGDLYAAGFVRSNNEGIISNCYTNVQVVAPKDSSNIKASGFALESLGGKIENSYACGKVVGYMTYGFVANAAGGEVRNCYIVVEQDARVYRAFTGTNSSASINAIKENCYWGYDDVSGYNMQTQSNAPANSYGKGKKTLAALDDDATDTIAHPFSDYLKGSNYPYQTYGLEHYGDWPVAIRMNLAVNSQDFLRAGLYYGEEYNINGETVYGVYAVGDYHDKVNDRRAIGTTVNTLMQGSPEDLAKFVTKRYYGVYYHVDMDNGNYCHTDDVWTPSWYYSFGGSAKSLFKDLTNPWIPEEFGNYRFCQLTEVVGTPATATIYYESYKDADAKHTDNNYDYLYDQQGDKNGVVSEEELSKGIPLTITPEEIEAARKNPVLDRPQ